MGLYQTQHLLRDQCDDEGTLVSGPLYQKECSHVHYLILMSTTKSIHRDIPML